MRRKLLVTGLSSFIVALSWCAQAAEKTAESPTTKTQALQLERQRVERAQQSRKEQDDVLDLQLRLASMALDAGDRVLAREVLMQVTQQMSDILTDKNFQRAERRSVQTLGGRESEKYFLGEPYEQLFAFLYLGVLDFQAGDYEFARSSFRSAQAADEMSNLEGYRSDCYLAFLLEALASKALNEEEAAAEAFALTERAYIFRRLMEFVPSAFQAAAQVQTDEGTVEPKSKRERKALQEKNERFGAALAMVASYLGVGLAAESSPQKGIAVTFDYAIARLDDPGKFSEAVDYLELFDKKEKAAGLPGEILNELRSVVEQNLDPGIDAARDAAQTEIEAILAKYRDPSVNVYLLSELGFGPTKQRGGAFGSSQIFVPCTTPARHRLFLLEQPGDVQLATSAGGLYESVDFQAMTRGGRFMDYLLAGQATTKRRLGVAADVIGNVGGAYGDAIAGVLRIFARSIHSEADVRTWNELPSDIGVLCASLPEGEYRWAVQSYDSLGNLVETESTIQAFTVQSNKPVLLSTTTEWL